MSCFIYNSFFFYEYVSNCKDISNSYSNCLYKSTSFITSIYDINFFMPIIRFISFTKLFYTVSLFTIISFNTTYGFFIFCFFFCGYPTNAKIIKESYDLKYISLNQLQHLLSIASFSSLSFIFVSLHLPFQDALFLYVCHIIPSLIKALFYHQDYQLMKIKNLFMN